MKSHESKMERLRERISLVCAGAFPGSAPVFGQGPCPCPLVVVGEAPGRDEARIGRPFVGKAGSFFIGVFEKALGMDRRQAYITNVIKAWPVVQTRRLRTRKPTRAEQAAFAPLLAEEIRLVDPAVILAVGKTAFAALLPHERFVPGGWYFFEGREVLAVYHPAYLLRQQKSLAENVLALERALTEIRGRLQGP